MEIQGEMGSFRKRSMSAGREGAGRPAGVAGERVREIGFVPKNSMAQKRVGAGAMQIVFATE